MERFLKRSIESLLANEYEAKEIILIDDGSKDSTPEMCESYDEQYDVKKYSPKELRCVCSSQQRHRSRQW